MPVSLRINGTFGSSGACQEGPEESHGAANGKRESKNAKKQAKQERPKGLKECKAKMLNLLALKDFTQSSMRERLLKAGFSEADVEESIKLAVENRFIDDKRFALTYIAHKSESGWGRGKVESEIEKYGIDPTIVSDAFEETFSDDDELNRAVKAVMRHHTSAKNVGDAHYRYLLGKGFSPSICAKAMRIWRDESH